MKKFFCYFLFLSLSFSALYAGGEKDPDALKIGVTIEDFNDVFMRYLLDELTSEAEKSGAVVVAADGKRDPNEQLKHVENFIIQKMDAVIVHVIDQTLAPRISQLCDDAGIPLVYVNRKPEDAALAGARIAAVASAEEVAGQLQAEYVISTLGEDVQVGILLGSLGSAPQIGRTQGAKDYFSQYPQVKVLREQTANFQRADAVNVVENWLASGDRIDAILANNDEMAIGALLVLEEKGMKDDVVVTGVDATEDAMKFIKEGRLDMTVFQDGGAQGRGAVQAALKLIRGENVEKFVNVPFAPVTKEG